MNILHHKSWHVRTKKNIEKVRRDEQRALEEQIEKARKADIAEQERRIQQLRNKFSANSSSQQIDQLNLDDQSHNQRPQATTVRSSKQHINFFQQEYENTKNKAHALEKKIDQEAWEKKVGILTYLGGNQQTDKNVPWYEQLPRQLDNQMIGYREVSAIQKLDPLNKIRKDLKQKKKEEDDLKRNLFLNKQEHFNLPDKMKDRRVRERRPSDRKFSEKRSICGRGIRPEDISHKGNETSEKQLDNRPDCELNEKELKLKILRTKRLKREQKECKKSKDLLVTQSPFFFRR